MSSAIKRIFGSLLDSDHSERVKFICLTLTYFLVIASYTIVKELKDSIFISVVGVNYLPTAKIIGMLVLVPAILFYSFLVDKLRRYQLLMFYSLFYGVCILFFGYFLSNPEIGIANVQASPYRLFGWFFYFFIEGFSPFVVSVFWAFANSVTNPEFAKKNYSLMVSGSKLGGMLSAGFAWIFLSRTVFFGVTLNEITKHQILFFFSAATLLLVPFAIILLMKKVPGRDMHGYEAAYQLEKARTKEAKGLMEGFLAFSKSMFGGLYMLFRHPYVMGIFGIILYYEILNVVLSYLRLQIARGASCDLSGLNCILFEQVFYIHLIGFLVSLFGTTPLLRKFGERKCLLLIPLLTGLLVFLLLFNINLGDYKIVNIVSFVFIGIRAINYAISYPVRESLYIPTVKDIKFKSKSWIDAFGTKFAKSFGSVFNMWAPVVSGAHTVFLSGIIGVWFVTSYFLGKRYDKAIKNNEVIGE